MRRWGFVSLILLLISGLTVSAMPLCEYRSPQTNLAGLSMSFSYTYHNDPFGLSSRNKNAGLLGVDYTRLYDTAQYGLDVSVDTNWTIDVLDVSTYEMLADGNYKRYFSAERDAFAYAGISARSSSSFQMIGLSANAGIGVGRFSDVTPFAKATRIDEYLVSQESLTESLHPVDLQILADEIASASSYDSEAELLAAIQDIVELSGRVKEGGLDALDIAEITRQVQDDGFSRYCGWDIKIGLGYEILDPSGGVNDILISGAFNYAFTTTPNMQFLIEGSFSGAPEILETNRVDLTMSYDYLIADFIQMKLEYGFSRETWASEATDTHQISFDFVLTLLNSADVSWGLMFEHRPDYLEWSIDVTAAINIELL